MFSTEVFIADAVNYMSYNYYNSYDEAKNDINLYIRFKLPTEFESQEIIDYLSGMILIDFIERVYINNTQSIISGNDNNNKIYLSFS